MGEPIKRVKAILGIILAFSIIFAWSEYILSSPSNQKRIITLNGGWMTSDVALGDVTGNGIADIVVGSIDGVVFAYQDDGTLIWQYDTGDAAIVSKPAIGDINQDGFNEVIVGVGSTYTPGAPGGVIALTPAATGGLGTPGLNITFVGCIGCI